MPLMISSAPTAVSPRTANTCACRLTQTLARSIARVVHLGATKTRERKLEQPEHHKVEPKYDQHGRRRRVLQLVDLTEACQVRSARKGEHRPDDECSARSARRSLAQLPPPLGRPSSAFAARRARRRSLNRS